MPNDNATPPLIVVVDDEDMVVQSLQSLLDLMTDYEVRGFVDPTAAVNFIRDNDVSVVVSDYMMPQMNGLTFLAKVRELRPDAPRIMLTGYSDKDAAIRAINDVGLYQYVEKPWDNDHLLLVLRNAVERQQLVRKVKAKLEEASKANAELAGLHREIVKAFV